MSDETENHCAGTDDTDEKMLATVWRIPREIPDEGRPGGVPDRLPEFWMREHRVPSDTGWLHVRDIPYVLRGRDHETAFMAQQVHCMPKPVQLIQGPPGSGKTSVLHNVGRYAAAQGYRVIELHHAAFNSHSALVDAFRHIINVNDRTLTTATVTVGERGGANAVAVERGGHVATIPTHDRGRAGQWVNAIRTESANPEHRGLLILLDDVQFLRSHAVGSESFNRVRAFLQFMHNTILTEHSVARDPLEMRTMLICAGMPDAEQTLLDYGGAPIEGTDILRMGPIGDNACCDIIMDHMAAVTDSGGSLPQLPKGSVRRLVDLCGGYAHHISHVAQNAQRQAMRAALHNQAELSSEDLSAIFEKTKGAKERHYQMLVRDDIPEKRITAAVQIIAQATLSWGDQLPQVSVEELVQRIMAGGDSNTDNLFRDVIEHGILEPRCLPVGYPTAAVPEGARETHYVFATNSMRTWLLERLDGTEHSIKRKEANQRLIDDATKPIAPEYRIPAWAWDHDKPLPRLEPMPPDEQRQFMVV